MAYYEQLNVFVHFLVQYFTSHSFKKFSLLEEKKKKLV